MSALMINLPAAVISTLMTVRSKVAADILHLDNTRFHEEPNGHGRHIQQALTVPVIR
ncbi:hypothetical protein [Burkholderia sp. TSV86]|uniref:hypothetical protein n=1 Tax=Burkholderia sp. TSV86 TaxID=1385594 RepID=UPI000A4500B3|nr:hypothetical protein [Burkholderia sp. TSV86]